VTALPYAVGAKEFVSMMPMVCVDAVAILFLFDLTNRTTLTSIREWFRQVRGMNKVRIAGRALGTQ
jgi:Gtp-binding protein of the ras superfamily involved in termination of M-phase